MAHKFKKQYGQNFLRSTTYALKLTHYLQLNENDSVIEIGPGDGMLTRELLETGAQVYAIEIDYSLIPKLIAKFSDFPNFHLINQDIMELNISEHVAGSYKVTGSLPYNISKQIISKFIEAEQQPESMAFIVQDEVAKAYAATAPKATFLSNWLRLFADVKKRESIPASQFFPRPKVDGGILEITPRAEKPGELISHLIRVGFSTPRKTLANNLSALENLEKSELLNALEELSLSATVRPAELSVEQWQQLASKLNKG